MQVVALLGMPGSGKTTVAQHAAVIGIPVFRLGATVVSEVERRGLDVIPDNEAVVRTELREQYGPAFMARGAIEWSQAQDALFVVLDGVYSHDEFDLLRSTYGDDLHSVAVVADRAIRYERLRTRQVRPLQPDESFRRDRHELENLRKGDPIALADHYLLNNSMTVDLLQDAVKSIVKALPLLVEGSTIVGSSCSALVAMLSGAVDPWSLPFVAHRAIVDEDVELTWHVCKAIGQLRFLPGLAFLLRTAERSDVEFENTSLHRIAASSIAMLPGDHTQLLTELLRSGSGNQRAFAADALGEAGDEGAVDVLADSLRRDEWAIALWASLSLAKLGSEQAVSVLLDCAQVLPWPKRALALDALAKIDHQAAAMALDGLAHRIDAEELRQIRQIVRL